MVWLALITVYIVWGSTYFAIALVVQSMPPLLTAGIRFLVAGLILAAYLGVRDRASLAVTRRQLAGSATVGVLTREQPVEALALIDEPIAGERTAAARRTSLRRSRCGSSSCA